MKSGSHAVRCMLFALLITKCLPVFIDDSLKAQKPGRLISRLSSESAAIVQLRNPNAAVKYFKRLLEFDEQTQASLEEWLCHEKVGLTTKADLAAMKESLGKIGSVIADCKQITLVFHSLKLNNIEFSLVIEGLAEDQSVIDEFCKGVSDNLIELETLLGASLLSIEDGPWFQSATPNPFSVSSDPFSQNKNQGGTDQIDQEQDQVRANLKLKVKRVGDLTVITNSNSEWERAPRKNLADNRSFQRVWKNFSKHDVACYASPKFVDFQLLGFPKSISDTWSTKNIASVGGSLNFLKVVDDEPSVVATFVGKFTYPRHGLAKFWSTATEIDQIPIVSFPFYELSYEQFDPIRRSQAMIEMQPNNPDGKPAMPKSFPFSGTCEIRYLAKYEGRKTTAGELLSVQNVKEYSAAKKTLEQQLQRLKQYGPELGLQRRESDQDKDQNRLTFLEPEERAKSKADEWSEAGLGSKPPNEPVDDKSNWIRGLRTEGKSLSREWMATGEIQAIDGFLAGNVAQDFEVDYADALRKEAEKAKSRFRLDSPFAIEVYSPRSWSLSASWWTDRWSYNNQYKPLTIPSKSRSQTLAMAKTAAMCSVINKIGSQLILYSQSENEMTVTVVMYENPALLFGETGKSNDFALKPIFLEQ